MAIYPRGLHVEIGEKAFDFLLHCRKSGLHCRLSQRSILFPSVRPLIHAVNFHIVNIAVREAVLRRFRSEVSHRCEAAIPKAKCCAVKV
jgi:hypothetical protein